MIVYLTEIKKAGFCKIRNRQLYRVSGCEPTTEENLKELHLSKRVYSLTTQKSIALVTNKPYQKGRHINPARALGLRK